MFLFNKFLLSDNEISLIFILHYYNFTIINFVYYLIIYCAKQSNHHLEKEAYYRDFAVKILLILILDH